MGISEYIFEKAFVQFNGDGLVFSNDFSSEYNEIYSFCNYSFYESSLEEIMVSNINHSENIFPEITSPVQSTDNSIDIKIGKKRGRKPLNERKIKKPHDRHKNDNRVRKIQVHYFNFSISFLNQVMNYLGLKYSFLDVDYKYKKKIKKEYREKLESKTIKDILLETPISKKYKNFKRNHNKNVICLIY